MHKTGKYQHLPKGNSNALTASLGKYCHELFPDHKTMSVSELRGIVAGLVESIESGQIGLIALFGLPGVGKSSHTPKILRAADAALGFQEREKHLEYQNPDGSVAEVAGHVCRKTGGLLMTVHADHFFRALGSDRVDIMLRNRRHSKRFWGDFRRALTMVRDVFDGKNPDVSLYMGTPDERNQKNAAGSAVVVSGVVPTGKKVVITEGVNAGEWHDRLDRITKKQKQTSMKTMKILFDMSLEDSLIRVLRRDTDKKKKSFASILHHRLQEYYNILRDYIVPALQDPDTLLLQKSREVPVFLESERIEILTALEKYRSEFESYNFSDPEQKTFILQLIREIHQIFDTMQGVTPLQMELWRKKKKRKKLRQTYNAPRDENTKDTMKRQKMAHSIKKLRKDIHHLKKEIRLANMGAAIHTEVA